MWTLDPLWNDKTKIADLHSPLIAIKINFTKDNMCYIKPWKQWTAHKTYSAVIGGWIRHCIKRKLVTKWLRIMFPHVSSMVSPVTLDIPYVFLVFFSVSYFWSYRTLIHEMNEMIVTLQICNSFRACFVESWHEILVRWTIKYWKPQKVNRIENCKVDM